MRNDYHAQPDCRAGSHAASFIKCCDHAIQRIVLAKEEDVVFATEVVVKIGGRKGSGFRNVEHARLRKPANAKFSPGSAQDFHAPRKIAALEMAISLTPMATNRLHGPGPLPKGRTTHKPTPTL